MATLNSLKEAADNVNVLAFLRLIREGETSQEDDAYRTMFGGAMFDPPPWEHPHKVNEVGTLKSSAAGAYQFLGRTWDALVKQYGFEDFGPINQDLAAIALIAGRGALEDVKAGRVQAAIRKCSLEWASLPGSTYGQPTQRLERALAVYVKYGGVISQETNGGEKVIPVPLLVAGVQALADLIPAVSSIIKPGSEVAARNVQAAGVIFNKVAEATNTPNVQAAIEKMQNDPDALKAARDAVHDLVPVLTEIGGGIVEARKSTFAPDQIPFWRNPAVVISFAVIPLVYMVAVAVLFGVGGQSWSDDIKTLFVTAIVTGALGSITGFFLGSSMGSQRKDAALVGKATND